MDASLSYATFNAQGQPFVEIYLHIIGESVAFAQADVLNNQATVEVVVLFKKGEEIVKFDKYNLQSPLTKTIVNFVDQKRYALPNGDLSGLFQSRARRHSRHALFGLFRGRLAVGCARQQLCRLRRQKYSVSLLLLQ